MRLLALDAATEACGVALLDGQAMRVRSAPRGPGRAEAVLEMVDAVLGEAGIGLAQLDGIAAGVGPGSFTGVRIGVAVAQGLAFGAGLPVVPVTTLETLALAALGSGAARVLACLDARMGEVYWGCFEADERRGVRAVDALRVSAAAQVRWPGAGRYRGIGAGFAAHAPLAALEGLDLDPGDGHALPDAGQAARLGALRLSAGEGIDPAQLKPQYVRDKVAFTEAERAAGRRPPPR